MQLRSVLVVGVLLLTSLRPLTAHADDQAPPTTPVRWVDGVMVHNIGTVDPDAWKLIHDKQQIADVAGLKQFAASVIVSSKKPFKLIETPHFLIYTAYVPAVMATHDALLLESGYAVAAHIFNLTRPAGSKDKGQGLNIWRGKAVYFIFPNGHSKDAEKFALLLHPAQMSDQDVERQDEGQWDLATLNGNGSVDVVTAADDRYVDQQPMVRAMTAAFIFRLHSPKPIEQWVETGLAYGVSGSIPYPGESPDDVNRIKNRQTYLDKLAHDLLGNHDVDYYLTNPTDHLDHVAGLYDDLTLFMYKQSSQRFQAFILGMKDGLAWEQSLETKYGIKKDRLESAYEASVKSSGQ
jgi:hypothetical protein